MSSREERQKCWDARDAYFACLDGLGIVTPGEEVSRKMCKVEKKAFEKSCAKSWIEHFNKRRVIADAQKEMLAEAEKQRLEAEAKDFKRDR
ncbi:uncharacterized protein EI90DRAFT_3117026 [Cantharellus anzutake]|uniref:uncharacterized protein n=1 Tax=Cantharellus anzutake TaxID=1750568 RepID=UPI0019034D7A|nr:uncharacterized protein EI90DRAFT_3117026 [Cantharellus anzutake]KAF8340491.1 hypothetical protein EI90DRAFT_3117026 [Cantharellus anzutake]